MPISVAQDQQTDKWTGVPQEWNLFRNFAHLLNLRTEDADEELVCPFVSILNRCWHCCCTCTLDSRPCIFYVTRLSNNSWSWWTSQSLTTINLSSSNLLYPRLVLLADPPPPFNTHPNTNIRKGNISRWYSAPWNWEEVIHEAQSPDVMIEKINRKQIWQLILYTDHTFIDPIIIPN